MTDILARTAEKRYGIKADPDLIKNLQKFVLETYGNTDRNAVERVFDSGAAADFLTVKETYFFREPVHFIFLNNLLHLYKESGIRICCAAVATGCEAYSIAMLIEAYNRSMERALTYHIDAFDISPRVIETACLGGVYSERCLREDGNSFHVLTVPYLKKCSDGYMVNESIKKNISFFVHNLMDELPGKNYDIVFFRNAFIYFLPECRGLLLSNLSSALTAGGLLIMGVSETAGVQHPKLQSKNNGDIFYFEKISNR